ncbi:hypothetical protein R6Q59_006191 [Mikania micrantha]
MALEQTLTKSPFLTSEIAKKKIKSDGIPVTKVIKLSTLRTDYKPSLPMTAIPCYLYDCFNQKGKHVNFCEKTVVSRRRRRSHKF